MNDEPDQAVSGPENRCFGCSPTNPIGLQLSFRTSGEQVEADFVGRDDHCGVPGVVHGGIVMTAMSGSNPTIERNRTLDVLPSAPTRTS